jgi:class 3 adenylate cyclase/tetratricopeptide (TPR) repeat protein
MERPNRKLATIMFTDIAGYTEQMSKDEDKAFALILKKRDLLLPLVEKHEGKLIKEIGDGTLTRYFKAENAIDCASTFQSKTDTDLNVRVGIHTGEVIVNKEDVFGDVVNIASRLESIAVPGSILLSKETIDKLEMPNKLELVSLGMQSLKGVGRLIDVYAIKDESLVVPSPDDYTEDKIDVHSDDEVPSIAIIPFENKGADEDVFYAFGISADLISDCSGAGLIRVASKKQIDDAGDLPQDELAKVLDVRYMANGELWRMGDMFQLSVELYDTKGKKVVWSDRWQEKWDNLPTIRGSLSDGLLKALDTKPKVEQKVDTINPEAYEFYLKAKHKYEKRENTDDTEIARGLLNKAIELDDNLIAAKVLLGTTYMDMGEYDKAIEIFILALKQSETLGDKRGMGNSLNNIGNVHSDKGDYDKALDYYGRSIAIWEEIGDKRGMGHSLNNIGNVHNYKGDYDKALDYYDRSLAIKDEIGDKRGMGNSLNNIGSVHADKGDYGNALDYYDRSLAIKDEIGDKRGMGNSLNNIGSVHNYKGDYDKALDYFKKCLDIQKEIGHKKLELIATTYLYLAYKHLSKDYGVNVIHTLLKEADNIEFDINLLLYELLDDKSYLITAYNQVQEKASAMEEKLKTKFLNYPIPKAIVEEWEKVK